MCDCWTKLIYMLPRHSGSPNPDLDSHLNASVIRPHLVLDPVFFKDVNWFEECEPFYVLHRFITGKAQEKSR